MSDSSSAPATDTLHPTPPEALQTEALRIETPQTEVPLDLPTEMPQSPVPAEQAVQPEVAVPTEPKPSYVKLAMRNMVRKRGKSLFHFALTTVGLLIVMVGLSYLTR